MEQIVWNARIADLPRGTDRMILNSLYNGNPPFEKDKAEENNIEINRSDLSGVNLLAQARRQWCQGFLKSGNFFTVQVDAGQPNHKREWSNTITKHINRLLKRSKPMMEQSRATGANVMLHGIGAVTWKDRRSPVPVPLPVSSLLIASETDIDFENLEWFSVFKEWTPTQLYDMTHGIKVDPGWNPAMVKDRLKYIAEQQLKQPNSTAYQYMPEKIEELIKQDKGYWGSDAVPTIDVWDTYFREADDGKGWYRRVLLDWGLEAEQTGEFAKSNRKPDSKNKDKDKDAFIYSSGKRKYANCLSEILHCNFGDCSAVAPFKYHSVRSLGWMLWGVCDLQNRLYCKAMEATFSDLMWIFRAASNSDLLRLKKADFFHMGVIPQGIEFVKATERYSPNEVLLQQGFNRNEKLMASSAASFTQDFDKGATAGKEMTATETMARINQVNALVSGMMTLAYTYEEFKYREIARRLCIRNSPDCMARAFRAACLKDGVPGEMLDVERWDITAERVLGAGNKTLAMAQAQALQSIRKNLIPDAQRKADHIFIEEVLDDPAAAEEMAPIAGEKHISKSAHDAQDATPRILRGLPYKEPRDAVPEDFVVTWLMDLAALVQQAEKKGNMATQEEIGGMSNLSAHIEEMIKQMGQDKDEHPRVKQYQDALGKLNNFIKGFNQRLQEQMKAKNGAAGGPDPETQQKLAGKMLIDRAKSENMKQSHAQKTAQRQVTFELSEQRKDRELQADLRRRGMETHHELVTNRLKSLIE